jgi:transcriptional regulator with GAF, ATPase, and Fis domain
MLKTLPVPGLPNQTTFESEMIATKRRLIVGALEAEGGNKVAAAKRLGISRSYLHRLISEFGL